MLGYRYPGLLLSQSLLWSLLVNWTPRMLPQKPRDHCRSGGHVRLCVASDCRFWGKEEVRCSGSWNKMRRAIGNCHISLYSNKGSACLAWWQHLYIHRLNNSGTPQVIGVHAYIWGTWLYKGISADSLPLPSCTGVRRKLDYSQLSLSTRIARADKDGIGDKT